MYYEKNELKDIGSLAPWLGMIAEALGLYEIEQPLTGCSNGGNRSNGITGNGSKSYPFKRSQRAKKIFSRDIHQVAKIMLLLLRGKEYESFFTRTFLLIVLSHLF